MRPSEYSVEDIQQIFIETCERLYGEMNHDSYFCVENTTENDVYMEILDAVEDRELAKSVYMDMSMYILQVGSDVFISFS